MMRTLIEAILSFSNHFGETLALDLDDPMFLSEQLNVDNESDYFEEVMRQLENLRHQIGSIAATARVARDLIKYGEKWFNDREAKNDE